jgi:carbon-monoxide dehydrogenase small subunit
MRLNFHLNGAATVLEVAEDRRLVDLLREDLGLTGAKEGCGEGGCGACAVLVDGVARLSCLLLAAQIEGRSVLTVEGLGTPEAPHPLQAALLARGAIQCGYCTPGMVISGLALLEENPQPSHAEIRAGLSGNLCRCTGYQAIVEAVAAAAETLRETGR